jgi:hypothetical protein
MRALHRRCLPSRDGTRRDARISDVDDVRVRDQSVEASIGGTKDEQAVDQHRGMRDRLLRNSS